jgi:TetR/AcrR family transcriptional regulator, ethionamide resistance regulator
VGAYDASTGGRLMARRDRRPASGEPRDRRAASEEPRDRRAASEQPRDLRRAILAATRGLLAERRFDELSVADILAAAGVSRASFYFYFASKHAVLAELVEEAVGAAQEVAAPWAGGGPPAPRAALERGTADGARLWREQAPVLRAIVEHWRSDAGLTELWTAMMERFTAVAAARIEEDRRSGRAPDTGTDARALAAVLTWAGERAYYLAAVGHPDFADEQRLVDVLTELWWSAIYRPGPGEEGRENACGRGR